VPAETSFAVVTEEVGRRLNGDRVTAMSRVLGRRRRLLSAVAEGAGLDAMLGLMGREIGAECWLLTGTGRIVGGTGASLSRPLALQLACGYLKAERLPAVTEAGARLTGPKEYSLFGVGGEPRITGWFLACGGREQDWPHELRESIAELAADVALERARLDASRTGDRKLAEAIITMLASGGGEGTAPVEIASLMRAIGMPPDGRYLVAAMCAESGWAAGPSADRWRFELAEELAMPLSDATLAGPLGDEIILLVPLPSDGGRRPDSDGGRRPDSDGGGRPDSGGGGEPDSGGVPADGVPAGHVFAARLLDAQPVLESDRSGVRLSVGISSPAAGMVALSGALHEASSARRLAVLRGQTPISVVTSDEVASHELLLATVPRSVLRSFRERMLGPLVDYDQRHKAELVPTLREFLACSGSWNACAARMYVHVNTVRYRIRRIEELTGRDLSSLDDQVDFFLALRIR